VDSTAADPGSPGPTPAGDGPDAVFIDRVYAQLRSIAEHQMRGERPGHTLQATALVHEALLRLGGTVEPSERGTRYFFAAAGEAMRRILVEHARARARLKRGGGDGSPLPPDALALIQVGSTELAEADILRLDAALARLEQEDADAAQVVRLRFFAGLSGDEAARALGVSPSTVDRDWAFARARLFRLMQDAPPR
jgi:RNA polymerase sigma factor (TIGR02999 family)